MNTSHATLLATFLMPCFARASPIVVLEGPLDESETVDAEFAVDRDLGRAWVNVLEVDWQLEPAANMVMRNVEGLTYDRVAQVVLYHSGDHQVVCGRASALLGMPSVRPTGNCPLKVSYDERTVDVGAGLLQSHTGSGASQRLPRWKFKAPYGLPVPTAGSAFDCAQALRVTSAREVYAAARHRGAIKLVLRTSNDYQSTTIEKGETDAVGSN